MIKIRYGVFETNSSSVHSLCIAQNDEINKLKSGELLVSLNWRKNNCLISYDEAFQELIEELKEYGHNEDLIIANSGNKEEIYSLMKEYDIAKTFEDYLDSDWLESYEETMITEHGDTIMMFGLYGHD